MYLSLVPESCVVPSWYRMSMVESEERPLSRPNSKGLFKSTKTDANTEIRVSCFIIDRSQVTLLTTLGNKVETVET